MTTRCSELERVKQCPGSPRFIESLPAMKREDTPESLAGTRVHIGIMQALLGPDIGVAVALNGEEAEMAASYALRVKAEIESHSPEFDESRPHCEEELWDIGFYLKGHPDLFFANNKRGLLIDYKTGWGEIPEADRNMQLRGYAVLLSETYNVPSVTVVLMERHGITRCEYSLADLLEAKRELKRIVFAAMEKDAPLHAGSHCKYCPANGVCKEAASYAIDFPIIPNPSVVEVVSPRTVASVMTTGEVEFFIRKWPVIQKIAEAIKDRAKEMAANGEEVPWTLKPGAKRAEVKDAREAFRLISGVLSADAFASCCSVKIGEVDKRVAEITGHSVKDAKDEVRHILRDVIEYKETAPQLELK